jgi:hypothetical protein
MGESRHSIFDALDPGSTRLAARWTQAGLRCVVCAGLAATVLRTAAISPGSGALLDGAMFTVLGCMAADYLLRLLVAPAGHAAVPGQAWAARRRYALSPVGLVDLAAVAPMGLALALGATSEAASLYGVLWVLKLARYSTNLALLGRVFRDARKPLMSVLLLFGSVLLLAAAASSPAW